MKGVWRFAPLVALCLVSTVHAGEVPDRAGFFQPKDFAATYRNMEEIFPSRRIARGDHVTALAVADKPLSLTYDYKGATYGFDDFQKHTDGTGLLVIHKGRILLERYDMGADQFDRFQSFSTGKSFVSTLVGLAVADGKIASVDDPLIKYLPDVKGTAYEAATIRNVLEMSSGTDFTEEYENPKSGIGKFVEIMARNEGGLYAFARDHKSIRKPGSTFYYASTDTEMLGALVARVTGEKISDYMSRKLWKPLGAEADGRWVLDGAGSNGTEMSAGGLNLLLRDYGRFGLMIAQEGEIDGRRVVPADWIAKATRPQNPQVQYGKLVPGYPLGYGFQWWCLPGEHRPFTAQGIHGQFVLIDPVLDLVMVKLSAWPEAWSEEKEAETYALFETISHHIKK